MREIVYVDRLFADYEDTPEIRDFKEEVAVNMAERVKALVAGGLGEDAAFDRAAAELGDITAIADEAGRKKRSQAIGQMYMRAKVPLTKRTAAGFTAATGLALLCVAIQLILTFSRAGFYGSGSDYSGSGYSMAYHYLSVVLLAVACALFTWFGLTQETASHFAMGRGRAAAYGVVCLVGVAGTGLAVVSFLFDGLAMSFALGIKVAFILPALCALAFLLMTEPKRQKPWLKALTESGIGLGAGIGSGVESGVRSGIDQTAFPFLDTVDPAKMARFGVSSGGLWLLSIALFLTMGLAFRWLYAWLIFPFALAAQVFMVTMLYNRKC